MSSHWSMLKNFSIATRWHEKQQNILNNARTMDLLNDELNLAINNSFSSNKLSTRFRFKF